MSVETLAQRRSPLAALAERFDATGGADSVTFVERPYRVQVELRGALTEAAGLSLPTDVGSFVTAGERDALCLAPGWWLVTDAPEAEARLECALVGELRALGGVSAVDVSGQRTAIDIAGPHAPTVLSHGCSLDLHSSAFWPGRCAQTNLAKAQIVLQQLDDRPTYRVYVRASFAEYLGAWLLDAAVEYV